MKNTYKIKILLLLIFFVQIVTLWQWIGCQNFPDAFHFSTLDLSLRLTDGIHNDQNVSIWLVRVFHNKIVGGVFDVFGHYLQFWNISFLANFISLAGVVGLLAGFYNFFSHKKSLRMWILFALIIFVPYVEIFKLTTQFPFALRLFLVAFPYLAWSMFGYWQLFQKKKVDTKAIALILIISSWYLVALPIAGSFCAFQ